MSFDPGPDWREVQRAVAAGFTGEVLSWRGPRSGDLPRIRTWIKKEQGDEG